nr:PREDICTED: glutelin type-A 2-like [Musa acuminata subsp. malaccensis]
MASSALIMLSFPLCVSLLLLHSAQAQLGFGQQETTGQPGGSRCRIERLSALEPTMRVPSEAGFTEYVDQNHEQFRCAGVAVHRRTILPRGLLLPSYSNAPSLVYVVQGRGIAGTVIPGCPETYQSFQQQREGGDEHQRIHSFHEGDIIALPAGVAHWCYNNGEAPVVAITVSYTSSSANQLDRQHRFLLAGRERRAQQGAHTEERLEQQKGVSLLNGFELELLAEALSVDKEVVRKIQNPDDGRGEIVRVDRGLQLLQPLQRNEEQERQDGDDIRRRESNGLEEAFCTMDYKQNIGDTTLSDQYDPNAGRITVLNSRKFPVLRFMQMSAVRGSLRPNTVGAPYWNINTHGIAYALNGSCQMQVVGHGGRTVFDGELRQGQLLVIPQHFVVITKTRSEHYEWVSFKTNDNPMVSQIVGKASVFRGMPVEVLINSYRISRNEAKRLKFNRGNLMSMFPLESHGDVMET